MNDSRLPGQPRVSLFATHLDAIRGLAALLVVGYHIRYKFFLDYADLASPVTPFTKAFYVLTSFGHDAVMIFFVLSGFLISGSVIRDLRQDRWSWPRYLVNRLSRLYVVLLPGLLLTAVWDYAGLRWFGSHVAYTGLPQAWRHDFFDVSSASGLATLLANAGFMQAIRGTPPLGSNVPLWSLTYELAYYLLFPALATALWAEQRPVRRLVGTLLAAVAALHFGTRVLLFFPIWLLGFAVQSLPAPRIGQARAPMGRYLAIAAFVLAATIWRHTGQFAALAGPFALEAGDFVVGIAFAAALWLLKSDDARTPDLRYERAAQAVAALSFTLYVVHMPLLIFLRAAINDGPSWPVTPRTMAASGVVFAATLAYAALVWFLFEKRTAQVRDAAARLLLSRQRHLQSAVS